MSNNLYVYYNPEVVDKPSIAYESNAFDIHFPDSFYQMLSASGGPHRHVTYSVPLGLRTFVHPDNQKPIIIIPRSSASLVGTLPEIKSLSDNEYGVKVHPIQQLRLANTAGLIDWDYRGEWQARFSIESEGPMWVWHDQPVRRWLKTLASRFLYHVGCLVNSDTLMDKSIRMAERIGLEATSLQAYLPRKAYLQGIVEGFDEVIFTDNLDDIPEEYRETSRGAGGFGSSDKK